jgi:hypothetical protein
MIVDGFDFSTLARMDAALEKVCRGRLGGDSHDVRKRVAESIIICARGGKTSLGRLVEAGERALCKTWQDEKSA